MCDARINRKVAKRTFSLFSVTQLYQRPSLFWKTGSFERWQIYISECLTLRVTLPPSYPTTDTISQIDLFSQTITKEYLTNLDNLLKQLVSDSILNVLFGFYQWIFIDICGLYCLKIRFFVDLQFSIFFLQSKTSSSKTFFFPPR